MTTLIEPRQSTLTLHFIPLNRSYEGIQYKSECVTLYDYFSLEEGEYLNDAIINFHLAYLAQEKLSDDNKKDVHIFSTHFYTKLSNVPKKKKGESSSKTRGERAYERVKRWTKEVDLFSKKLVVIPICEDNHWYVLLICNPGCIDSPADERLVRGDPYFIVMDSLGGYHTSALSAMRSYLRYEYLERKGKPLSLTKEKMGEYEAAVPEQDNDCDCGVYLLHYIELIFRDPGKFYWSRKLPTFKKWFTTSDIKNKREDIAIVIKEVAKRSTKTAHMEFPEIRFSRRSKRHAKTEAPIDVDKVAADKYKACGEEEEEEEDKDDGDKGDAWLRDGYSQIFRPYSFGPSGFWTMAPLRYAAKFDPFLSLEAIAPGWRAWGRNPRKGRDQISQRSVAEP